eukprot:IDg554t1
MNKLSTLRDRVRASAGGTVRVIFCCARAFAARGNLVQFHRRRLAQCREVMLSFCAHLI